jgi:hypothetical protein
LVGSIQDEHVDRSEQDVGLDRQKKKSKSKMDSFIGFLNLRKTKVKKTTDGSTQLQPLGPSNHDRPTILISNDNSEAQNSHFVSTRTSSDTLRSSRLTSGGPIATRPSSAVLESRVVSNETAVLAQKAKQSQDANNILMRVKWAESDRKIFLESLKDLRKYIKDLEDLIRLEVPQDPSMLLGQSDSWQESSHTEQTQDALRRLHDALASVNPRSSGVTLGVQVLEDPEKEADEFASAEGSPSFELGSLMFVLQAHLPEDPRARSLFLYTQTLGPTTAHGRHSQGDVPLWSDIGNAMSRIEVDDASGAYRYLGYVDRSMSTPDCHHLYSPATGPWLSPSTLKEYLDRSEFKNELTKQQRFRIARLLTISFIHFAKVVKATHQYPRPERVRYYSRDGLTDTWLNESGEPKILNPFLTVGFGMQRPARLPGTASGLSKQMVNPVVELGLLLYQVGSGSSLEYGNGDFGVKAATEAALGAMDKVDRLSNGSFSEIVTFCLGWRGSIYAPAVAQDYVWIDRVRHWIKKQEEKTVV